MPKDEFDLDDPMEMIGVAIEGRFDEMADAMVDEFILMHFDEEGLWSLFRNPFYRSTHAVLLEKGEEYVSDLIKRGLARWAF
jgi:hypothetical protein